QRLGNHQATVRYLSRLTEDELYDETHRVAPSPQLRRYVMLLRRLELHPAAEPQTLAAIRNLERARQRNAAKMLLDSRSLLDNGAVAQIAETSTHENRETKRETKEETYSESAPLSSISAPPPISSVLRDIYQEETNASN